MRGGGGLVAWSVRGGGRACSLDAHEQEQSLRRLPLRWRLALRESGGVISLLPRAAEVIAVLGIVPECPAACLGCARTPRMRRALLVIAKVLLDVLLKVGPPGALVVLKLARQVVYYRAGCNQRSRSLLVVLLQQHLKLGPPGALVVLKLAPQAVCYRRCYSSLLVVLLQHRLKLGPPGAVFLLKLAPRVVYYRGGCNRRSRSLLVVLLLVPLVVVLKLGSWVL